VHIEDIPLNDILLFIHLVEEKNYSRAAEKLGIDVSSFSKRIIRLENNLKTQLIQRTTRQMNLTEAGHILYQHAINLRQELYDLNNNIHRLNVAPTGKLRIKAANSFGHAHLIDAIRAFLILYPQITCDLVLGSESTNLSREEIDILISIKPLDDLNLIAKKMGYRSTGIYAAPSYLQAHGVPELPQDLLKHNCLLHLDRSDKNFWPFQIKGQVRRITVSGNFSTNTNVALMNAAVAGLGLVKIPSFMVYENIKAGRLQEVLAAFALPPTPVFAVYAKHRVMPKKIKLFVDFLTKWFAHLPE